MVEVERTRDIAVAGRPELLTGELRGTDVLMIENLGVLDPCNAALGGVDVEGLAAIQGEERVGNARRSIYGAE